MSNDAENNNHGPAGEGGNADDTQIQGTPQGAYGDCVKSFRVKEYARARDCFSAWVEEHPDDPEARYQLARVLMHLNAGLDEAESHILKAVELSPDDRGRYLATYGEMLVHTGRFAEGRDALLQALEAGISRDPDGEIRYVAEYYLSLAKNKLRAAEGIGHAPDLPPGRRKGSHERARTAGKGGMFIAQSVVVHLLVLLLLSVISGMHGRPETEPEDFTYIDLTPVVEERAVSDQAEGGGGEEAPYEGLLPGPVARLLGLAGPEKEGGEASAIEGVEGARTETARVAEGLKESVRMDSEPAGDDSMQARLDTERLEAGFGMPRHDMSLPEDISRAESLDIDTGESEAAQAREAAPSEMTEREPGAAQRLETARPGQTDTGERAAEEGRKAAAGIEGEAAPDAAPMFEAGGTKAVSVEDLAAAVPAPDYEFVPSRAPLDIDTGAAAVGETATAATEEFRSLDRRSAQVAQARVSTGGSPAGERATQSGQKASAEIEGVIITGETPDFSADDRKVAQLEEIYAERPRMDSEFVPSRRPLDIDAVAVSGGQSQVRSAAPEEFSSPARRSTQVAQARVSAGGSSAGERATQAGRKSAASIEGAAATGETPRFTSTGRRAAQLDDISTERRHADSEFVPSRRALDIDAGVSATGGSAPTGGAPEEFSSPARRSTQVAQARVRSGGGTSAGERSASVGSKRVSGVSGGAAATAEAGAYSPAGGAWESSIKDLPASRDVSVPSSGVGRRAGLGISVTGAQSPAVGAGGRASPGTSGSAGAPSVPSAMSDRAGTAARPGTAVRRGGSGGTGRGYSASGGGGKSVGGISSGTAGDSLSGPYASASTRRSVSPGTGTSVTGRRGPDVSGVAVGGGGGEDFGKLLESTKGKGGAAGGKGGKGAAGSGGRTSQKAAAPSGPGRGSGESPGGGRSGGSSVRPESRGSTPSGGKEFAAESLGRPVGDGSDKYRTATGREAMPRTGEKYASLGPESKRSARPASGRGPKVRIITPVSGDTETMAQTVSGTVSGARVDKVTLAVNNDSRVVSVDKGRFNASVALFKGRNIITVMAFDGEGNVGKDFVTLNYKAPESDVLVKITEPRDGQVYDLSDASTIIVRGTLSDKTVRHAKLVLNGHPKDIVVRSGRFEQEVALVSERNRLFVEASTQGGKPTTSGEVNFSTVNIKPKEMMVILTWDKPNADMDLHVYGPSGGHTYYKNPDKYTSNEAIPQGKLEQDAKGNYGPEVFAMEEADPGIYTIKSNYYYSGGDGEANATVTVILYGDNPARRIVRVFGPHPQKDTKTGEDMWEVARLKMPEGIFLED